MPEDLEPKTTAHDPVTGEALGSDPVPMGSNVARDDSSDAADAGQDTGAWAPSGRDPEDREDGSALPDDGLS